MENLIKNILKIENSAQDIVRDARKETEHFEADLSKDISVMAHEIDTNADGKISQLEEMEHAALEERLSAIQADTEQKLAAMNQNAEQNTARWADEIFASIIM